MNVRRFKGRNDVRGILRVNGLAWREAYDGLLPDEILQQQPVDPSEDEVDYWLEAFRENPDGFLVAVDDEEVIRGYADIRWGDTETKDFVGDNEAGLKSIYVEPAYWGQGIGTDLLERGLEIIPDSVETVRLETLSENEIAHQFYEVRGFKRTDSGEYEIAGDPYSTSIYSLQID